MEEQRTIRITGLEGKVNLEGLHKGIYLVMGKPECIRVQIVTKDELNSTSYPSVHFWEDQPTVDCNSFVDVAAGEVIIADAWVAKQMVRETYRKAVAPALETYLKAEAPAPALEVYKRARAQAKKEEKPNV